MKLRCGTPIGELLKQLEHWAQQVGAFWAQLSATSLRGDP